MNPNRKTGCLRPAQASKPYKSFLTFVLRILSNLDNKIAENLYPKGKCCCYSATLSTTTKVDQLGAKHVIELKNPNFNLYKQKLYFVTFNKHKAQVLSLGLFASHINNKVADVRGVPLHPLHMVY